MTKEEEKLGCLKLSIHFACEKLDGEERDNFIEQMKTFEGKDEYTKMFFSNDEEVVKAFPNVIKNPSELDESLDGIPDVSARTWLECCCFGALGVLEGLTDPDPKC